MKARFEIGDRVVVLDLSKSGHVRTPYYIRGKIGLVVQKCGAFLNPEDLSVGNVAGPVVVLYRVSFAMTSLWPGYEGSGTDCVRIEIYDHWLASAPSDGTGT